MNTGKITAPFRKIGLMHFLDTVKYEWQKFKLKKKNNHFKIENPSVKLPPDYLMFESYKLDYHKYYFGGKKSAEDIINDVKSYIKLSNLNILDWGCGPARILRHLPDILGQDCSYFGTDYNPKTIDWCSRNLKQIDFKLNDLNPPLDYTSDKFGFIYGISIFTHLSEENHYKWFDELVRITKKDGVILLTTAGAAFEEIMTESEKEQFNKGFLITRGQVKEGHRVYAAFQPPSFLKILFEGKVEVLKFIAGQKENWGINQDQWILRVL